MFACGGAANDIAGIPGIAKEPAPPIPGVPLNANDMPGMPIPIPGIPPPQPICIPGIPPELEDDTTFCPPPWPPAPCDVETCSSTVPSARWMRVIVFVTRCPLTLDVDDEVEVETIGDELAPPLLEPAPPPPPAPPLEVVVDEVIVVVVVPWWSVVVEVDENVPTPSG